MHHLLNALGLLLPCALAAGPVNTVLLATTPRGEELIAARAQSEAAARLNAAAADRYADGGLAEPEIVLAQAAAPPEPPEPAGPPPFPGLRNVTQPAVVLSQAPEPQTTDDLKEDLAVMARLLDRAGGALGVAGSRPRAMGLDLLFVAADSSCRPTYLEDYGVIFTLQVGIPLLPPASSGAPADPTRTEADADWENARREVLEGRAQGPEMGVVLEDVIHLGASPKSSAEYAEAKVKELQDGLLRTLKHASRIRHLKPADHVLVCVSAPAAASTAGGHTGERHVSRAEVRTGPRVEKRVVVAGGRSRTAGDGAFMTIRVKQTDAEEFAKGAIGLDEFRSRARIAIYPQPNREPAWPFPVF